MSTETKLTEALFYRSGEAVPAAEAKSARMGKSGTIGVIGKHEPCHRCAGMGGWHGWPGFTCFRCGGRNSQWYEYVSVKVYTAVGLERARKAAERAAERAAAKERAAAVERTAEFMAWRSENGAIVDALKAYEGTSEFLTDLRDKVNAERILTENQVTAAVKALAEAARRAEEAEASAPLPEFTGRAVVEGEILVRKIVDTDFGSTVKVLVRHADGWRVWGSLPASISDADRGDYVRFTARVEASKDDPAFGFFSRPTKGEKVVSA